MKPNTPPSPRYPSTPGFKERGGTSQLAAEEIRPKASAIREEVMRVFIANGREHWTPETMAHILKRDLLSIRPRFTELKKMGKIEKTGDRVMNGKGKTVATWRRVPLPELKQSDLFQ